MAGDAPVAASQRSTVSGTHLLHGWSFDATFAGLALGMTVGVTLDFRAHRRGLSFAEEGFLTPSHVLFYAAFLAIAVTIVAATLLNRRQGAGWPEAIPLGYQLGLVGVIVFMLAGPMDFLWHSTFGFEQGTEALTSPTHLLLALGAVLFFSSPLRAAWYRSTQRTLRGQVPMLVSAGLVMNTVAFFTLYGNPLDRPMAAPGGTWPGHGVLSILAFSAILVGLAVVLVSRFDLVPGAFTLIFGLVGVAVAAVNVTFEFVPTMIVTGLLTDALVGSLRPAPARPLAFRLFAFVLPVAFGTGYFLTTELVWGIEWTAHTWMGAIMAAGFAGVLVSYVAVPHAGRPTGGAESL